MILIFVLLLSLNIRYVAPVILILIIKLVLSQTCLCLCVIIQQLICCSFQNQFITVYLYKLGNPYSTSAPCRAKDGYVRILIVCLYAGWILHTDARAGHCAYWAGVLSNSGWSWDLSWSSMLMNLKSWNLSLQTAMFSCHVANIVIFLNRYWLNSDT